MKLDELLNEQSTNTADERFTPRTPAPQPVRQHRPSRQPQRAYIPHEEFVKPLETRAEVLDAVLLLSDGKVRISSINGGKKKKKAKRQ